MKYIHHLFFISILAVITACGSGSEKQSAPGAPAKPDTKAQVPASIREGKGIGEIKNVELTDPLDETMVKKGKAIVDMKCAACHKLTDQRVVGPGFQDVTNKRKPEWIMNMITNVEVMLDEDPVAQQLLEECLTRMPNQNVSIGDARDILEFLRSNDLATIGKKDGAVN
ncbi:MAG: cytochrome c [Cyclobacteriaceae bacterium]|nr:cytochrome c [Cyclobacteriaceae bacterium]